MIKTFKALLYFTIVLIWIRAPVPALHAQSKAMVWGTCHNFDGSPVDDALFRISGPFQFLSEAPVSPSNGRFQISGLETGEYTFVFEARGYQSTSLSGIEISPAQILLLRVKMSPDTETAQSQIEIIDLDYTQGAHLTDLTSRQIHGLPSAHNIWSLIENQDLSATTNRIDVGGLYSGIPALFSSRGGASWTQNSFSINGLDVSDPYYHGTPLLYPDFFSLNFTRMINAGNPVYALSPGGYFDLGFHEGGEELHGGISMFYLPGALQSNNITPELETEGILESNGFNHFMEGNAQIGGPVIPGKLNFFTSLSAFDLSRNMADFEPDDKSTLLSGLIQMTFRISDSNKIKLFWTGQTLGHPSYGAARRIPFIATTDRSERFQVSQVIWESRPHPFHFFKLGISYSYGRMTGDFQSAAVNPYGNEIFESIPRGAAPLSYQDTRKNFTFLAQGESLFPELLGLSHRLQYGIQWQQTGASSREDILSDLHLRFFNANPLEVVFYNTPSEHGESARHLNFYLQDSLTFPSLFTFYFGVNLASSRGGYMQDQSGLDVPTDPLIKWLNFSPRAGILIPLSKSKKSLLQISLARYFAMLPLNYLAYGHPDALGGLAYQWIDNNLDECYQSGESGRLLRREGPFYGAVDPNVKRPYTDELVISYSTIFGKGWKISLGGFHRVTRNLIRRLNSGVTFHDYQPVYLTDIGDDRIQYNYDDLLFTVYNQNLSSLGNDFYLLSNIESDTRNTTYFGMDLNLTKKFGRNLLFFLSLTAIQAEGAANPGNTEWENDDMVIGSLFDSPNNLINAMGRTRFDRGYTGRLGILYNAPFNINLGLIIKYYDGQPFSRRIIVEGFNQGPFTIQAHPRGVARYEYNKTIDIRLEKIFFIRDSTLRLILDGFNILNRHWATEENEWTGPDFPLRYATAIQSPRVFRLGLRYDF